MKVKLKLVALNQVPKTKEVNGRKVEELDKDGNVLYEEPTEVIDAVQIMRLDNSYQSLGEFGSGIANAILGDRIPDSVKKTQEFFDDMKIMHNSKGKEFEIDEEWIPLIKEKVRQNFSALIFIQVEKFLDLAVLHAKNKENKEQIKKLTKK